MNKIAYAGAEPLRRAAAVEKVKAPPKSKGHAQDRGTTGRLRTYRIEDVDRFKSQLKKEHYDVLAVSLRYSYTEAVDVLNVGALGTVKSRLNRACNALDALLAAERENARLRDDCDGSSLP